MAPISAPKRQGRPSETAWNALLAPRRALALLAMGSGFLALVACNDAFTAGEDATDDPGTGGEAGEAPAGGTTGSGGDIGTGGTVDSSGGTSAVGGTGGTEGSGGTTSTTACWPEFVCDGTHKLGSQVSAHGKNWTCEDGSYCINCGVYQVCRPGEFYQGASPWQCETAWKDQGECE